MPQPPQQPFVLTIEQACLVYGPTLDDRQRNELALIMNEALTFHYADGDPLRSIGYLAYAASTWKLNPEVDKDLDFPMIRALAALVHVVADSWYAERTAARALAEMEQWANGQPDQPEVDDGQQPEA